LIRAIESALKGTPTGDLASMPAPGAQATTTSNSSSKPVQETAATASAGMVDVSANGQAVATLDDGEPSSLFDAAALLTRCMGDRTFAGSVLGKFQVRVTKDLESITSLVEQGDWEKVTRQAHSLKGAASNLSATALAFHAGELERAGRAGDADAVHSELVMLQRAVRESLEAIPGLLERI
jgi:HPt (histidine-containing phosphotransfer) domain-containing protein